MLRSLSVVVTSLLLITGCSSEGGEDFEVSTSTLTMSQVGDHLSADFTGGEVAISATADLVAEDYYTLEINIGNGTIFATIDDLALQTEVTVVAEGGVDFVITEAMGSSLEKFAIAVVEALPVKAGLGDKVFRVASLYAVHGFDIPVENRLVTSERLRASWNSLCSQFYSGSNYTARFDYECNCGWRGCSQCSGTFTEPVGGANGGDGCFASCGAGCDTSAYADRCGDHDGCLNAGKNGYQCSDEWVNAADAYLNAPDC